MKVEHEGKSNRNVNVLFRWMHGFDLKQENTEHRIIGLEPVSLVTGEEDYDGLGTG